MQALIGHTGFVGSNLAEQHPFDATYHSRNSHEMRNGSFDLVVCAGVQAKKWWANQNPEEDWTGIQRLLDVLETIHAREFVLISTVDVYPKPVQVTENTPIKDENHAYGTHRLAVEAFVRRRFPQASILRLPGLFGQYLKKNVIFDLLNDNCLEQINPASAYQYYNLSHLWSDIQRCRALGLPLLNVATEPVLTADIIDRCFPEKRNRVAQATPFAVNYDMWTDNASLWESKSKNYLYDREMILEEIAEFVASSEGLAQ